MLPTPQKYTLVAGLGEGETTLTAFDAALLESGLGNLNLLKVSSILPPQTNFCETLAIPPGSLVPTAYGAVTSKKPGELIAAAVAVGIPEDNGFGVIMECSGLYSAAEIEKRIANMVIEAFKIRKIPLGDIKIKAIEHVVKYCGCAFAGVALWY